jgi:SNF2 family DNA or RNA helicase
MKLREYQQEDANFLASLPCSACFNEQRTGKTPTALETIKLRHLENKRILIITTASSVYQWKEEYEKWLNKPCEICLGNPKQKQKSIMQWTHGLVISLDSFKETQTRDGLVKPILQQKPEIVHKIKRFKICILSIIKLTEPIEINIERTKGTTITFSSNEK